MADYIPTLADTRLERNRSGKWEIRWTEPGSAGEGRRPRSRTYSCGTADRRIAEEVRQGWLSASHAMRGLTGGSSRTVGDVLDYYVAKHIVAKGLSDCSMRSLRPIYPFFGTYQVQDINRAVCEAYAASRRGIGRKDGTIRRELGSLRAAIAWCIKDEFLPSGTLVPNIPLPSGSPPREVYLRDDEEKTLFDFAAEQVLRGTHQARSGLFVCIALEAPSRARAIELLEWDRVDFVKGLIDFRTPGARVTSKRRVPLPISDRLLPVLEAAKAVAKTKYVLTTTGRAQHVRFLLDTAEAKFGIRRVTRHDLRRTWATLRAQRGVPLFAVAGALGDTVATTEKNYAHHSPEYLRAAMNTQAPTP